VPLHYTIDCERRLVISVAEGRLTLADVDTHQKGQLADPQFDPTFDQIGDVSRVSEIALSPDDVRILAMRHISRPAHAA
jgi:hypothetical protein